MLQGTGLAGHVSPEVSWMRAVVLHSLVGLALALSLTGCVPPESLDGAVAVEPSVVTAFREAITARDKELADLRAEAAWLRSLVTFQRGESKDSVAITMDDLETSPALLAIGVAKEKGAPLTLFPTGDAIIANPEWFLEAIAAGFEIGNHTSTHEVLDQLSLVEAEGQIAGWNAIARDKLGYQARFFRPPAKGGWADGKGLPHLRAAVARQGLITVLWDVGTVWALFAEAGPHIKGPEPSPQDVADYVVSMTRAGSIICLHEAIDTPALPLIIDGLRAKGFRLVTLSELLGCPPGP